MSSWLITLGGDSNNSSRDYVDAKGARKERGKTNNIGSTVFCIGIQLTRALNPRKRLGDAKTMSSSTVSMKDSMKQRSKMLYPPELEM